MKRYSLQGKSHLFEVTFRRVVISEPIQCLWAGELGKLVNEGTERQAHPCDAGWREWELAEPTWEAIWPFVATNLNVHLMQKFHV